MSEMTLTALVTGFPSGLRSPKPLPGETMAQLVIRNHPDEWSNLIALLKKDCNAAEDVCARLRRGETSAAAADEAIGKKVEQWMNYRLPSHGRTLQGLADLREDLKKYDKGSVSIVLREIIWPRQKDPLKDKEAEALAKPLGVTIVNFDAGGAIPIPMDFKSILEQVHGDYLWILPSGSRLAGGPFTSMELLRVFSNFKERPKVALYSDQRYCVIYRVSALRTVLATGMTLSAELRDNARMLQEAGFECAADNDPDCSLVEIESVYGGKRGSFNSLHSQKNSSASTQNKPWWQRLLGIG